MKVGDKAICRTKTWQVIDENLMDKLGIKRPDVDQILTIRSIEIDNGHPYLRFEEVINIKMHFKTGFYEVEFHACGFELVDTTKFNGMLQHELLKRNINIEN